jgi:hypothetical protein
VHPRAATCPTAPEPTSLMRRALMTPHVPWLRTHWEGYRVPCVLRLRMLPPSWEGSGLPHILRSPVDSGPQA